MNDAHLIQFIFNRFGVAILVEEGVCYDEAAFLAHNSTELIKSNRHTALLKVNLFRCSHPEHILSPFSNSLGIEKVFDTNVLGYGVTAPGTAAKSKGWSKLEVIKVTDTTLGRRCIDKDTAGFHSCFEFIHLLCFIYVDVEGRGMTIAAVCNELRSLCNSIVKILGLVHGKYRGKLLVCEFFADINGLNLTDQDLGLSRYSNACHFSDSSSFLSYDLGIQCAVDKDGLSDFLDLVFFKEVASSVKELFLHFFINALQNSYGLLGSTDHTIVKGLGVDDGVNCKTDICAVINNGRCISGSYTNSRFTGGVSCFDHSGTTGGKDDICVLHYHVGKVKAWDIDPSDDSFRRTCGNSCFQNNFCSFNSGFLSTRMRADDDRITGFQGNKRFIDCCGGRVGCRDNCSDQSYRFQDLLESVCLVFFYNTTCLSVLICIVNILCCVMVLDNLVFHDTHACFLNSHFGKWDTHLVSSSSSCLKDLVDLLLCVGSKDLLCFFHCSHFRGQGFWSVDDGRDSFFLCHVESSCFHMIMVCGPAGLSFFRRQVLQSFCKSPRCVSLLIQSD